MRHTPTAFRPKLVLLIGLIAFAGCVLSAQAASRFSVPIVFTQLPVGTSVESCEGQADGMLRCDYGGGARLVRLDPDGGFRILSEGFESACEPDVSFDGQRILFAGRRTADEPWNIWEMNAEGGEARQITRDLGNCRTPAYQSTLYTIVSTEPWYQIMFVSDAAGVLNDAGNAPSRGIFSCKLDGSEVRRVTLNLSDDLDPYMMDDGRVLLASWQRMDLRRGLRGRFALFGVNIDGTDYALFNGQSGARVRHMPCVTGGGLAVFVEADRVGWDGAGQLGAVSLRRPIHTHRPITRDDRYVYHSPSPLPGSDVVVSRRPADGSGSHGLCRLDPVTGNADVLFDDPEFHDMHATVLAARPEPDGRSSGGEVGEDSAKLYCLNVYQSDPEVMAHLERGAIRRLRVLEGVPGASADGLASAGVSHMVPRRVIGDVPIEADGSFHLELHPDVPIQLQTLDENGMALRTCGWIWVKHKEPRGCIGCHEDPELTPENRYVDALKKPGMRLLLPPERRRTVDFKHDVLPIIEGRCSASACHGGEETPLRLGSEDASRFNQSYLNLMEGVTDAPKDREGPVRGKYVTPGEARTSLLAWRLFGENVSRPWDDTYKDLDFYRQMPPHPGIPKLTSGELATFIEWIDMGAHWDVRAAVR